jgi:DNA-binding beta-propeller fold protein YncE
MKMRTAIFGAVLALYSTPGHAELIVSGNDGHQPPEAGQQPHRVPDSIAVIDFSDSGALKVLGSVTAPASVLGPPTAIYVAPNEKWAVATAGSKADPADPAKSAPDDVISVLDISTSARPRVIQTLHAGMAVSSIAVNRTQTLALTADTIDDTVSIFTISGNRLTPAGKLQLDKGSRPWCITFMPDGKSALLSVRGGAGLQRLNVNGTTVTDAGPIAPIRSSMAISSPDGKFIIANGTPSAAAAPGGAASAGRGGRGGGGRGVPQASVLDTASGAVLTNAPIGAGTEFMGFSHDAAYMVATITNGSHSAPTAPDFNDFGLLYVFKASGNMLTKVAEAHTGHWCQGALFSKDDHTILVQCSVEREIEVFRFDGNTTLTRDDAATLKFDAAPASMATANSR